MAHLTKECMKNIALACKEAVEAHEEKYGKDFPFEPQSSWQGLSDDEINDIKTKTIMGANGMSVEQLLGLIVSLTEQALRNKNGY